MLFKFIFLILGVSSTQVFAYPEFIGYGYSTCLACHYSGTGGGGLTDYGRALFATEIAATPIFNISDADDEKLAEWSGFFGKVQSPFWLKPGYKFRRLYNESNPGSKNKSARYYTMQNDLNLASFTSEEMTLGFIGTLSYVQEPRMAYPNETIGKSEMMPREYYLRWQQNDSFLWYLGFMDKAYGIKHPDHSAYSRSYIRMGQNDQVHSVMMQWKPKNHELFFQPFLGNVSVPGKQQSKGATLMYEYEPQERMVYGASVKHEADANTKLLTFAGHTRIGFQKGHALLFELGGVDTQVLNSAKTFGMYNYFEFNYRMARGFNFQSIFQMQKNDFRAGNPDNLKWGLGLLVFPMQRIELRVQALQKRTRDEDAVRNDEWVGQGQLHLSL